MRIKLCLKKLEYESVQFESVQEMLSTLPVVKLSNSLITDLIQMVLHIDLDLFKNMGYLNNLKY